MTGLNFTLLQEKTPQLYQIATFAEEYVYSDPQSSIAKARLFAERIATILYKAYHIEMPQARKHLIDAMIRAAHWNILLLSILL